MTLKEKKELLRKERIARMKDRSASGAKPTATKPQAKPVVAAATKPQVPAKKPVVAAALAAKPVTRTPAAPSAQTISARICDPSKLSKTSAFDLSLYGEGTETPKWMIVADGTPVGEIHFEDQAPEAKQLGVEHFTNETFANTLTRALAQEAPASVLAHLKCRFYAARVQRTSAYSEVQREVLAAADAKTRVALADLRNSYKNVLNLVLAAQDKNFIKANDLKAELHDQMVNVGVESSTAIHAIEAAWHRSASTYLHATLDQAEEWMDLTPEAFKSIENLVNAADVRVPEAAPAASAVVASMFTPSASHNMAIPHTATAAAGYRPTFG